MKKIQFLLYGLLILLGSCSTFDDLTSSKLADNNAEYAIPLVQSQVSIQKIIENFDAKFGLIIDPNGDLTLNYKGETAQRSALDFFSDINGIPILVTDTVTAIPLIFDGGVRVDSITLKTGKFKYTILNDFGVPLEVTFTSPQLKSPTGETFKSVFNIPGFYLQDSVDVSGYSIVAEETDSFYMYYQCRKVTTGEVVVLGTAVIQPTNFVASYAEGFLGSQLYDVPRDTIEIDFFDDWQLGTVQLVNPRITMTCQNSFGFPVRTLANLINIKGADGAWIPLQSPFINQGINFDYPNLTEVGESKQTIFEFTKDNSNISQLIGVNPKAVEYDIDAITNPDLILTSTGFLTDSSVFRVEVEVNLPLWGTAKNYAVTDTFDFEEEIPTEANYAELKVITDNGLPLDVAAQIYLATANGNIIDSLFTQSEIILAAANVDADGNVTELTSKTTYIDINEEHFAALRQTKKLIIRYGLATKNNGTVPVRANSSQTAAVRIGMRVGLK